MARKQLGEMITYTHIPVRVSKGSDRTWRKTDCEGTAMYIGYRYIYDGYMEQVMGSGEEYGWDVFIKGKQHKVWLVIKDDITNPFYVYPTEG